MKILVTGANGFIGKNLVVNLQEHDGFHVIPITKDHDRELLQESIQSVDFICHLAGVNKPENPDLFTDINIRLTEQICNMAESTGRKIPILFSSSTQAQLDNPYGRSKASAENLIKEYSDKTSSPVYIFRLPGVFGKWCRPEYNSVVATFCHHIANDMPINIHDPATQLKLVYIDDVIAAFLQVLDIPPQGCVYTDVSPEYRISLGDLAELIKRFHDSRNTLCVGEVGAGLPRALYATYLSYLQPEHFSYGLKASNDDRGKFVEVLKTEKSGQFSYFTANPGSMRGGHYHHTKNEKFLVVRGEALFRFRHLISADYYEIKTSAADPVIVETIPGWVHDITNTGEEELVVLLWANEIFDKGNPDTVGAELGAATDG